MALPIAGALVFEAVAQAVIAGAVGAGISYAVSRLFPPDPVEGPRLGDLSLGLSDEGSSVVQAYGPTVRVPCLLAWTTDLIEQRIQQSGGGKGGSGSSSIVYQYFMSGTYIGGECPYNNAPVSDISSIWGNGQPIFGDASAIEVISTQIDAFYDFDPDTTRTSIEFRAPVSLGLGLDDFVPGGGFVSSGWSDVRYNGNFIVRRAVVNNIGGVDLEIVETANAPIYNPEPPDLLAPQPADVTLRQDVTNFEPGQAESFELFFGDADQLPFSVREDLEGVGVVPAYIGRFGFHVENINVINFGNTPPRCELLVETQPEMTVAEYLDVVIQGTLLSSADIDTSALSDQVFRGYRNEGPIPTSEKIKPLLSAYQIVQNEENNGLITYRDRASVPVVQIENDSLGAYGSDGETPGRLALIPAPTLTLPRVLNVRYLDPQRGYQSGTTSAENFDGVGSEVGTVDVPFVMRFNEADKLAQQVLWSSYAAKNGVEIALPPSYAYDDEFRRKVREGYRVQFSHNNRNYDVLVRSMAIGANWVVRLTGFEEDPETLNQIGRPDPPDDAVETVQFVPVLPEIEVNLMDVPALRDEDQRQPGYYVAPFLPTENAAWRGARLFESPDTSNWADVIDMPQRAIVGRVISVTNNAAVPGTWDTANTFRVQLFATGDVLESFPRTVVENGFNRALMGSELLAFAGVTALGASQFDVTDMLRGMRGTSGNMTHAVGEYFTLLTGPGVYFIPINKIRIGQLWNWRAVPSGGIPDRFPYTEFTPQALNARLLPPLLVQSIRDPNPPNETVACQWRAQNSDILAATAVDVPKASSVGAYEIDVLNAAQTAVVATKTLEHADAATSPMFIYPGATQTSDGLTAGDPVNLIIYEISAEGFRSNGLTVTIA